MTDRPTMADVARKAGVGVATVDRVLNGRRKVREENALRVYEAATELGYYAAPVIRYQLYERAPTVRFGFVLPKEKQPFYQHLSTELKLAVEQYTGVKGKVIIRYARTQLPGEYAELLTAMIGQVDRVAASSVDHPMVTLAVEQLRDAGVPVFALLNDFAQEVRQCYVGLNNMKVGRTAGWMLANMTREPGTVAILVGGNLWKGHQLRELGFRSYFREYAPEFRLRDSVLNLETRQLTYEMMLDLLASTPDLRGIYITGGGMEGAITALQEARGPGEVPMIVHPLTQASREALAAHYISMVISTPVRTLCQWLVNEMAGTFLNQQSSGHDQYFLQPEFFLPESGRY